MHRQGEAVSVPLVTIIFFLLVAHTHPTILTQITLTSTEIPPEIKASSHPSQQINNPHSCRVPSPAVSVCRGSVPCPHTPSSCPSSPQPTPAHPHAQACRHRLSPNNVWQQAPTTTPFQLRSSRKMKCGAKLPVGPTVRPPTLTSLSS